MPGMDVTRDSPSAARTAFDDSIMDAETLLDHCNSLGNPLPQTAEVFKRAGLVMALTAWETYVEDRVAEGVQQRASANGSHAERFMIKRLEEELKRFNNPSADKTRKLFLDYLGIDVTDSWSWQHFDQDQVKDRLDSLLKKRGDAVHRAKRSQKGPALPHLVTKDELEKAIRFFKNLVEATDKSLRT